MGQYDLMAIIPESNKLIEKEIKFPGGNIDDEKVVKVDVFFHERKKVNLIFVAPRTYVKI